MQFVRKITQSKHLFFCEVCLPDGLQLSGGRRLLVFSSARKKKECSKFTKQNVFQKQMYQETNKAGLFGVFWVQGFWGSFFGESWGLLFVCFLVLLSLLLLSLGFGFFCLVTISKSLKSVVFSLLHILWWQLKSLYEYGHQCT